MTDQYNKGTTVKWEWGNGEAKGKVTEIFTSNVKRTIDGNEVNRKADNDSPAYMIEQEDGSRALKSHSEIKGVG